MVVNNGARTIPLTVRGTATAVGPKKALVGGTDRIPEDFQKARHFDDGDHQQGSANNENGTVNNNNNEDDDNQDEDQEVIELPEVAGSGHVVRPS